MSEQVLTKSQGMLANIDPFGNKWGIGLDTEVALYYIGKVQEVEPTQRNPDGIIVERVNKYPDESMAGQFTTKPRAQQTISFVLGAMWDKSDAIKAKREQKRTKVVEPKEDGEQTEEKTVSS